MKIKYIWILLLFIGFTACQNDDDSTPMQPAVELTAGSANFTKFVSIGNSLTAGFTDNALFIAGQENSFPNLLSQKFGLVGGGAFTQPLMNDNVGGLLFGGQQDPLGRFGPRLYFDGSGPAQLPGVPTTEVFGPTTGATNNMAVPGAASFHLLFDGYGNPANLPAGLANPYYVRMASAPNATVLGDALSQAPTFVSLWIGNNDVLGYATSGGDTNLGAITPQATFDFSINTIMSSLQNAGVQGVMANVPYVTSIPHFTTIPYNPIPLDGSTAGLLNGAYAQYNGGLQLALAGGFISAEEAEARTISFEASETNTMVLVDETLTDLSGLGLPSYRQSTADDLFVLPLLPLLSAGYGTQIPLEDKWVLLPSEQMEIRNAIDAFNVTLEAAATSAGFAFVDANALLIQLDAGSFSDGNFTLTSELVLGGAFSLDGVHPTSRGYALIANEFLRAIDATYGSTFIESGNTFDIGAYPTNFSPFLQ
ncbi:MAG: G-D-S-L family lipolytic protein [Bacteroidia bacterium]|nr:G-D-S-L family lipolytic protein [Bacteroidia bacterium]NND26886.1 G-D-S-L family lipolytic protein [Flavobacteriaceae bacterium]MBT8277821.1 G-D-S-L family lipolytic protein [Bacteroidia bacterium]NNK61135.1 G-D-S-L family lipolytic protein [Flavobacteriaceae bacterium]NNL32230.1 G-D-S-L family lipolytic protein [Flavobacteriaceae bacterium]